jgi:hypothetical protein
MSLKASLLKNIIVAIFILGAENLHAQTDTLYIRSNQRTTVTVGKASQEFSFGLIRITRRSNERLTAATDAAKFDIDLVSGKRLLVDLVASPYRVLEIQRSSSENSISGTELARYFSAQKMKSTTMAFEYLEKYKKGFFTTDALALINAINADEQLRSLANALSKENYYLATDLALGLVANPGKQYLSNAQLKQMSLQLASVAAFLDQAGTRAIKGGQYQKGIDLYKKSNQLIPRSDLSGRIVDAERTDQEVRYNKLINDADSLEKANKFSETVRSLQRAHEIKPDAEVSNRIEQLDVRMQDSLYQKAVFADKTEPLIFYRKKGYLTYLSRYPNGKYMESAETRLTRLNKEIHRVNKLGLFYGWGTVSFKNDKVEGNTYASTNNIGIGRLTETRYLGLDFSFNQDFFQMRDLSASGSYPLNNAVNRIILTNDFNNRKYYTGVYAVSFSYGVLFYKLQKLRLFAGGTVGWGQLETWVYGYTYNIINDKLPYSTAGKNAYYYKVDSEYLNTDLPYFGVLLLGEFKGAIFKCSITTTSPTITNVSVGYAF